MIAKVSLDVLMMVRGIMANGKMAKAYIEYKPNCGNISYNTIDSIDDEDLKNIAKNNCENKESLTKINTVLDKLDEFIEKYKENEVLMFELNYDAMRSGGIKYGTRTMYKTPKKTVEEKPKLEKTLDDFEQAVIEAGYTSSDTKAYIKITEGKKNKYVSLTLGELIDVIRDKVSR